MSIKMNEFRYWEAVILVSGLLSISVCVSAMISSDLCCDGVACGGWGEGRGGGMLPV